MKQSLYLFLFFLTSILSAQNNLESELDSIQDETQATKFLETHTSHKGSLVVFNKEKHKTQLAKDLFSMGKGSTKVFATDIEKIHYKIIDTYEITAHRASYIYLDGSQSSASDIKALQDKIILKYKQGFRFAQLAKMYSMDRNATRGGDSGWITKNDTSTELETAILNETHGINEIFTLDVPEKNHYYVIVKTHNPKVIEEIKVLKVSEKI